MAKRYRTVRSNLDIGHAEMTQIFSESTEFIATHRAGLQLKSDSDLQGILCDHIIVPSQSGFLSQR